MVYFNIVAFVMIFFIVVYSSRKERHPLFQGMELELILDDFEKAKPIVFMLICAFALFSRLYEFPNLPIGINQDEAMAAVNAKALLTYGEDISGLGFPVYLPAWNTAQMNILESLLMIPAIGIFGMNSLSVRLPMLLASLASIAVIYDFTKRMFGGSVAVLCLFLVSINPWHIMLSRWGLESNLFPACVLCAFYFLYRGTTEKKPVFLYISMLFWAASMYAYGIAYFAVPFILIVSAVYLLKNKVIKVKTVVICFFIYFTISLPIFLMMAVNYFILPSFNLGFLTIPYFPHSVRMNDLIFGSSDIIEQARNNFIHIIINILQFPDVPWNLMPEFGTLYIFSLPLAIYGYAKMKGGGASDFIVRLWLAASLLTGMIINSAGTNQINILFFPLIILCTIGLNNILSNNKTNNRSISLVGILPIAAYLVAFLVFLFAYQEGLPGYSAYRFYEGFGESVVAADQSGSPRVYVTSWTQNESSANVSEILTLYHCDIDSRYYRGETTIEGVPPYSERYLYTSFTGTPGYDSSAVYVINIWGDGYLFPQNEFSIIRFGDYGVAKRR